MVSLCFFTKSRLNASEPMSLSKDPGACMIKLWSTCSSKSYIHIYFALVSVICNCKKIIIKYNLILKIRTNPVSTMIESLYLQGSPITVSILRPVTNGLNYPTRTMVPWGLGWLRCFVASTLLQRVTPPFTTFPARINLKAQVCIEFHSFGEAKGKKNGSSITYLAMHRKRSACYVCHLMVGNQTSLHPFTQF